MSKHVRALAVIGSQILAGIQHFALWSRPWSQIGPSCSITCPAEINVPSEPGVCGATVFFAPTSRISCGPVTCTPASGTFFPVGTTSVTCATSAGPQCSFDVTVHDIEPPVMTLAPSITLWPPNENYVTVSVSQMVEAITDNCSQLFGSDVIILGATSDEPEIGPGTGSGNTLDDIVIAQDCKSIDLRSERSGNGNGRVYRVTLRVYDESTNDTDAVFQVCVPHDRGKDCIEDAAQYAVNSSCGASAKTVTAQVRPGIFSLEQNFPNPFNPSTTIMFAVPTDVPATVRVYDRYGRLVRTLVDSRLSAGSHSVVFDAHDLPSGMYIYRLEAGDRVLQRRMTLIK